MSRCALYLLIGACLCGCGSPNAPDATTPAAQPAVTTDTGKAKKAENTGGKAAKPNQDNDAEPAESATEAQQAEYEPPFPERENLFLAPKRRAQTKAPGNVEQSVELLGFANVRGPRVILSINGNVVPIAEGGQEAGIEVISIQPPAVVLQRDRERWQATLEN